MTPHHSDQKFDTSAAPNPAIRAIIFDWGGVFTIPRGITDSTRKLEKSLKIPDGTLGKRLYDNEFWTKAQIGVITDEEFWELTLRQFDIFDSKGVENFKKRLFSGERTRLRSGVIQLVKQLKRHYTIALLTNADNIFRPLLKSKFHIDGLFNYVIISAEVGLAKPDPNIFRKACEIISVRPEQCVFIDDSLSNVQSASNIGMHAIQYVNSAHQKTAALRRNLKKLGLLT